MEMEMTYVYHWKLSKSIVVVLWSSMQKQPSHQVIILQLQRAGHSHENRSSAAVKFIYSEKATKFCEISTVDLTGTTQDKSTVEISQNFVAFSECMNFITNHMYLSVVNFSVRVYKFRIIVNFATRNLDRFDFEHWQIILT